MHNPSEEMAMKTRQRRLLTGIATIALAALMGAPAQAQTAQGGRQKNTGQQGQRTGGGNQSRGEARKESFENRREMRDQRPRTATQGPDSERAAQMRRQMQERREAANARRAAMMAYSDTDTTRIPTQTNAWGTTATADATTPTQPRYGARPDTQGTTTQAAQQPGNMSRQWRERGARTEMPANRPQGTGGPGGAEGERVRQMLESLDPAERQELIPRLRAADQQQRREIFTAVAQLPEAQRDAALLEKTRQLPMPEGSMDAGPPGGQGPNARRVSAQGTPKTQETMTTPEAGATASEGSRGERRRSTTEYMEMLGIPAPQQQPPYVIPAVTEEPLEISNQARGGQKARMPREGRHLPAISAQKADGSPVSAETLRGKPAVIILGSVTCPVFRGRVSAINALADDLGDDASVLVVYTIEAHPSGSTSPYASAEWIPDRNRSEGAVKAQPATMEERMVLARELTEKFGLRAPLAVDTMDNATWQACGSRPNSAVVLDAEGRVVFTQEWAEPEALNKVLSELVSTAGSD